VQFLLSSVLMVSKILLFFLVKITYFKGFPILLFMHRAFKDYLHFDLGRVVSILWNRYRINHELRYIYYILHCIQMWCISDRILQKVKFLKFVNSIKRHYYLWIYQCIFVASKNNKFIIRSVIVNYLSKIVLQLSLNDWKSSNKKVNIICYQTR